MSSPTFGGVRGRIIQEDGSATIPFMKILTTWARQLANLGKMTFTSPMTIQDVPVFADNAAALAGGMTVGQVYRIGDNLAVVH